MWKNGEDGEAKLHGQWRNIEMENRARREKKRGNGGVRGGDW